MSQKPDEPEADESEADGFELYEQEMQRRAILMQKLGVTLRLSQVQYKGADGELITESYLDYARRTLIARYPTRDTFLTAWLEAEHKYAIVARLYEVGVFIDKLQEELGFDLDAFDLIGRLAFDRKGLTRAERADRVRSRPGYLEKYGKRARKALDVVLTKFSGYGYMTLDDLLDEARLVYFVRSLSRNTLGSPEKIMRAFGGREPFRRAMRELQDLLYQD